MSVARPQRRHQPVERRAAVLVAEHDRVAQLAARLGRRMALDPGDERDVGEARERVLSRVEDRRVGERLVARLPLGNGLDRDALDERLPCAAGRELAVERERERVLSRSERPEQNAVLAALAARQHEVLVKRAVHRHGEHGRLAARRTPVAARARRAHHGHDLGRPLQPEGVLVERGRGGQHHQCEECRHRSRIIPASRAARVFEVLVVRLFFVMGLPRGCRIPAVTIHRITRQRRFS